MLNGRRNRTSSDIFDSAWKSSENRGKSSEVARTFSKFLVMTRRKISVIVLHENLSHEKFGQRGANMAAAAHVSLHG